MKGFRSLCMLALFSCLDVFAQHPVLMPPHGKVSPDDLLSIVSEDNMPGPPFPPGGANKSHGVLQGRHSRENQRVDDDRIVLGVIKEVDFVRQERARALRGISGSLKPFGAAPQLLFTEEAVSDIPLTMTPVSFQSGKLMAAAAGGVNKNGKWTSLVRYREMPDGRVVRLEENDLGSSGGRVFMTPESIKLAVNGKPATDSVIVSSDGSKVESVFWVQGRKSFSVKVLFVNAGGRKGIQESCRSCGQASEAVDIARALVME